MKRKRILLIADVKGWGGWVRGEYIKKYLEDEFDIELMDEKGFKMFELISNHNLFTIDDFNKFKNRSNDKEVFDINDFNSFIVEDKVNINFDLYYPLFHTMLIKKCIKRLFRYNKRVVSIVTGFPTVKPCFISGNQRSNFKQLSSRCKALFANNLLSLEDLEREKTDGMKTYYCPRGVDEKVFYPMGNKQHKQFTVVYVGKPVKEKGLIDFIKPACDKVGARLVINDRNYTNALGQDEMRALYNQADAYIVASTIDGTPNPALEAAACGVPIISNKIGNMPEFIQNGQNGFIVQDRDINKYANRLKILMNEPQRRFEMGQKAREEIVKNWTWKKVLENERKAFRDILNG